MKPENRIKNLLLVTVIASLGAPALADITVDKTNGVLTISSDIDGTVSAKVIGPDDKVVVNERFSGNSFSWSPSSGPYGAYRYDVRIFPQLPIKPRNNTAESLAADGSSTKVKSDYAGGSVKVINGQIDDQEEALQ